MALSGLLACFFAIPASTLRGAGGFGQDYFFSFYRWGAADSCIASAGGKHMLRIVETDTLARKLGTTAHVSPLLMKARRLGLHGAADLERAATTMTRKARPRHWQNTKPDAPRGSMSALVIYGRGALCLGFDNALPEYQMTQDVDGIIRLAQLDALIADERFWDAVENTNRQLEPKGLYITRALPAVRRILGC